MKRNTRTLALLSIVLCASAIEAWSMGYREKSLDYVDILITNQRYDEAILFLTDFIKKYPSLFDSAQRRMKRITRIRSAYNASAATLIEVLKNDPLNQERKLAIIAELESYEKAPNPAIKEFVAKTKELALFTYNQAQFEAIMEQGRSLIDNRNFTEATRVYESGFSLYSPEFKDAGFDQSIVDDAFNRVEMVTEEISRFAGYALALNDAFNNLASSYNNPDDQAYATAWSKAVSISSELAASRNKVVNNGRALEASFVDIAASDPTITDNSFLPFAFRLVLGRKSGNNFEGVVGALDAHWTSTLGIAQTAIDDIIESGSRTALIAYDAKDWNLAASAFLEVSKNAAHKTALLSLWNYYAVRDLIERSTAMGQTALRVKGAAYLASVHAARIARSCATLATIQADIESAAEILAEFSPEMVIKTYKKPILEFFEQRRSCFQDASKKISALSSQVAHDTGTMRTWGEEGFGSSDSQTKSDMLDGMISSAMQRTVDMQITAIASAAAWEYGLLSAESRKADALLDVARNNLYGIPSEDPVLSGLLLRYPVKANELLNAVDVLENSLRIEAESFIDRYDSYPDFISESLEIKNLANLVESLAAQAKTDQAEAKKLALSAREQKILADYNRKEAESRISELKVALKSSNFIAAKDRINLARERYQASLEFEYDEQLRMETDRILSELATVVRKAENEMVVADTRLFLNKCKELFLQGELEQAQSALLQAKMTWALTNSKPDFETEYWLRLVNNSLAIQRDRSIPVTSSTFPEVSMTIALAKRYFEEGSTFLAKRDRTAAVNSFTQAKQYILEVKSIFPASQEASILELKIDQISDTAAFTNKFKQQFSKAKIRIEENREIHDAYNDLKVLESIQPQYPGLKTLMEQAEILIGFKPQPPDSMATANAKVLVQSAQNIFDKGQNTELQNVLEILQKAMLIDPGLKAAGALKDRVALRLGGDAAIVLPSVAEIFYKEATKYFTKGDFIKSRDRLTHLITVFPEGKSMKKVADLEGRLYDMGY